MNRPWRNFALAVAAAPFLTYFLYRLAKELGFLDPPWNREHEERRTIVVALFAFVLFASIFLFGHANAWPRVWAIFGVINAVALLFFAATGALAARRLWKIRHPKAEPSTAPTPASTPVSEPDGPGETPLA
jgi:drug/metabolite transporter superfamily protein YnfA